MREEARVEKLKVRKRDKPDSELRWSSDIAAIEAIRAASIRITSVQIMDDFYQVFCDVTKKTESEEVKAALTTMVAELPR